MSAANLHERASALFLEIRTLPPAGRAAALAHAVGDNHELRREVLSLLEHDPGGDELTIDTLTPANEWSKVSRDSAPLPRQPDAPSRIGPYRVIERIGRGGSGYVLLAEQDEPVRRRVAIKIVPHAAVSPELAARFEFERRALESVEHVNIARILDAGRTPDGLPYIVMDYVHGTTITEHCRRNNVPLRQRIELILEVADAVQHAHQRGVIHRDLKPGNILVSESPAADGLKPVCRPHVLDFGIAKPIGETWHGVGGGAAMQTIGMPLGTPAYMAPEQTGGAAGGPAIDTRADVYALGATLYELAAGRSPIDTAGDAIEALRRIRESVPPAVSRVRSENAAMFAADPVPRSMLADLDCILDRALEKSPDRRYPTASALADDLRRLLRREPIVARPPTLRYRATRFAQRNRVLVTAAVLVLLALVTGVVGLTLGLVEARRQQREAVSQTQAQMEINRFLTDDLLAPASPDLEGEQVTAIDLLNNASRTVDQRFSNRPLIAAAIHHTLGEAYAALGELNDADAHLQKAVMLRSATAGPNAPETVRSEIAAAGLLVRRQRNDEADVALTNAITRARMILGPNDPALYAALNDLGVLREAQDRAREAIELLEEALRGRVRLLGPRDRSVFASAANLAQAYDKSGDIQKSLAMLIESLRVAEDLSDAPRMTLIELNNNIGATYQDLNLDKEAAPYLRKADELAQQWLRPDSPDALTLRANLAGLEAELGNPQRAMELLQEVIETRTRVLGPDAYDTLTSRYAFCNSMWIAKRFDDAAACFLQLLPDVIRSQKDGSFLAASTRLSIARTFADNGRLADAEPYARTALEQFTALYGPDHARTKNAASVLAKIAATEATTRAASPNE